MATLVRRPTPGAIAAALYAVRTARLDSPRPILDILRAAAFGLSESEANFLPDTLGHLLRIFQGEPRRRTVLLDVIATFDLVEALDNVIEGMSEEGAIESLLTAAKLYSNPGANDEQRSRATAAFHDLAATKDLKELVQVLIDPAARPKGEVQRVVAAERWPGIAKLEDVAPLVAISEEDAPSVLKWLTAAALYESGASLRRLPAVWQSAPMPGWLGPSTLVLAWTPRPFEQLLRVYPNLSAAQFKLLPATAGAPATAVRLARDFFGADSIEPLQVAAPMELLHPVSPDVYHLGSFGSHEVAVLTGTRRFDLYTSLREALPPARRLDHTSYWTFSQVVALRTWQYFRSQTLRHKPRVELLASLAEFAGASSPTDVGVTADGHVLRRDGNDWINIKTEQIYLEQVRTLDEVFEPFQLGGADDGQLGVPALLGPTNYSKVHPVLLGGSPAVAGTRIPVKVLAEYEKDQGPGSAAAAYGLDWSVLADVLPLGHRLVQA